MPNYARIPALIDPHVHFRTPGGEHKEDWITASRAAIAGGITTVLDMPNTFPPTFSKERMEQKWALIEEQLKEAQVPLRFGLYLGADEKHLDQFAKVDAPIKIYMGSSTGDLFFGADAALEKVFAEAGKLGRTVAIHAEDEHLIQTLKEKHKGVLDPAIHSTIRAKEAAVIAVEKAIFWAIKYNTPLYLVHVSTKDELTLIRRAKKQVNHIFAEATPHHLFLNTDAYKQLKTYAQVNPPLRDKNDQEALFEALLDGTIDTVGSDHAPHTQLEKEQPYGKAPSGMPGVETLLPLLLNEVHEGRLTLERVVELTSTKARKIFNLPNNNDFVIVDLSERREVKNSELFTKCKWSPFAGKTLVGWPVYTKVRGHLFRRGRPVEKLPEEILRAVDQDSKERVLL